MDLINETNRNVITDKDTTDTARTTGDRRLLTYLWSGFITPPASDDGKALGVIGSSDPSNRVVRLEGTDLATKIFAGKRMYNVVEYFTAAACAGQADPDLCNAGNALLRSLNDTDAGIAFDIDAVGQARFIRSMHYLEEWRYQWDYARVVPMPEYRDFPGFLRAFFLQFLDIGLPSGTEVTIPHSEHSKEGSSAWYSSDGSFPYWRYLATLDREQILTIRRKLAEHGIEFDPTDDDGWAFISIADIGAYLEETKALLSTYSAETNDPSDATFRVVRAVELLTEANIKLAAFNVALRNSPLFDAETELFRFLQDWLTEVRTSYEQYRGVVLSWRDDSFLSKFSKIGEIAEFLMDTDSGALEDIVLFLGMRDFAGDAHRREEEAKRQRRTPYAY